MEQPSEAVRRALDYPYGIPSSSYALVDGQPVEPEAAAVDPATRHALLAYGSNAAPRVLAGKLAASPEPVLALRTVLRDFDVVYSAHVSRYGAVPATLGRSPGTEVPAFVVYVTEEQLELISPTEPNYELARFDRPSCTLERGDAPAELRAYVSRHGSLLLDGSEIALAAIEARDRRLPAMGQREVLELVREALCPERSLSDFISLSSSRSWPSIPALRSSSSTRGRSSSP